MDTITFVLCITIILGLSFLYIRESIKLDKEKEKNRALETEIKTYKIMGNSDTNKQIETLEEQYKNLYARSLNKDEQIEQLQDFIKLISCGHFKPDYDERKIKFDKKDLAVKLAGELISQDDMLSNTKTISFIPYSEKL